MDSEDEQMDVVLTVGELDATVVALREFLHVSGAVEVQAVVDLGDEPPALVTCGRLAPIEVVRDAVTVHLPHTAELDAEPPSLPAVPPLPPLEVDPEEGTVTGPLGGVAAAAQSVLALADVLGGRSVALAFYATTDPEIPLGIAARPGEDVVLTLGEQQFRLPEGA